MHPANRRGAFFMKLPLVLILVILLLAGSTIWIVSVLKEKKEKERTRLEVRKLVLSIRLNQEQEEKIFELEWARKNRAKHLKDSLNKNLPALKKMLAELSSNNENKIASLLDSAQISKYKKYRLAQARKKSRQLKLFRKKQKS